MPDNDKVHWPGRGHVATFIRCLHLLDLDLLEDWPGISEQTFHARVSQQNMQLRIKGVEWSLYRLFERYSPTEARDKLRPFFPALTSLQSANLRAALLRVLTDLKKNGMIPRDVVLRKTMLDECKGERFEELLSCFATLVLRKIMGGEFVKVGNIAEPHAVPLILAYRHSIQTILQQRQQAKQLFNTREAQLDQFSASLSLRRSDALTQRPSIDSQQRGNAVELLKSEWAGDNCWINTILYGAKLDNDRGEKSPNQKQYLSNLQEDALPQDLLTDLNRRLLFQRERLDKWKALRRSLPVREMTSTATMPSDKPAVEPLLSFDKHQGVVPQPGGPCSAKADALEQAHSLHGPFAELLKDMNHELSSKPVTGPERPVGDRNVTEVSQSHPREPSDRRRHLVYGRKAEQIGPQRDEVLLSSAQASPPDKGDSSRADQTVSEFSWLNETQAHSHEKVISTSDAAEWLKDSGLVDRTRKSLAAIFSSDLQPSPESPELPKLPVQRELRDDELIEGTPNRRGTLLERTRQSLAATAARSQAGAGKVRAKGNRMSQLYPINQFETPQRQSMLSPPSNGSTPREKLFSEDAEYTSVFKSRPKIAQSPAFSPDRSAVEDSILARDLTILDIGSDDVEYSSGLD